MLFQNTVVDRARFMRCALVLSLCAGGLHCGALRNQAEGPGQSPRERPTVVELRDPGYVVFAGWHMEGFEDFSAGMELADVRLAEPEYEMRPADVPTWGLGTGAIWVRFTMINYTSEDRWYVEVMPSVDRVEFFLIDKLSSQQRGVDAANAPMIAETVAGRAFPYAQYLLPHRNYVFPVRLDPGREYEIYMRVTSAGSRFFATRLRSFENFRQNDYAVQFGFGLYFGFFLSVAIYNLYMFLATREKSYLYYVIYVVSFGLTMYTAHGYAKETLWPNSPEWNSRSVTALGCLSLLSLLAFSYEFLSIGVGPRYPILRALFRAALGVGAVAFVYCCFFVNPFVWTAAFYVSIAGLSLVFCSGCYVLIRGDRQALFFVLGWTFFLLLLIAEMLMSLGVLSWNWYSYSDLLLGSAIELGILSYALADRYRVLKREKSRAEKKLVDERERIYGDLHDQVGSELTGALVSLRSTSTAGETLVRDNVESALRNLRDIVYLSNPASDAARDLEGDMREYLERLESTGRYQVEASLEPVGVRLPMTQRLQVLRIFLEWMTNVVRHSRARSIRVDWLRRGGASVLRIYDNGDGFAWSGESQREGQGLRTIRGRALRLGARVRVRATRPGSLFRLRIPLTIDTNTNPATRGSSTL